MCWRRENCKLQLSPRQRRVRAYYYIYIYIKIYSNTRMYLWPDIKERQYNGGARKPYGIRRLQYTYVIHYSQFSKWNTSAVVFFLSSLPFSLVTRGESLSHNLYVCARARACVFVRRTCAFGTAVNISTEFFRRMYRVSKSFIYLRSSLL